MKTMTVHYNEKPIYDIVFGNGYKDLNQALEPLHMADRKVCIVSESNVAPLFLNQVKEKFEGLCAGVVTFVFKAGEESKHLGTVADLYRCLIENKLERKDMLVALGGGVTGDLTGYAAATYLRGIDFIQMPTSLLSQVDSSIGGKTGVDFDAYKNMVGAFHQPKLVYMNFETLKTLKESEYLSGMGEIIKHGLIKNVNYYTWIKEHTQDIINRDLSVIEEMVYESCTIKRKVVEVDPHEKGERANLNFGHTIGHAVEKLMNFSLLHGECVSIGMAAAAFLSWKRQLISEDVYDDICNTLKSYKLPVSVSNLSVDDIYETTKSDKKMESGQVKFILIGPEGHGFIDYKVSEAELKSAIASICI